MSEPGRIARPGRDPGSAAAARETIRIRFRVQPEGKPKEHLELTAHLFDGEGNHITSKPVGKDGEVELDIPTWMKSHVRLFFAPTPKEAGPKEAPTAGIVEKAPTLAAMRRVRAYEPVWTLMEGQASYTLAPIPEALWQFWIWCVCRIRGQVVKPVTVGGVTYELPVCHARVHVCEVDPWPILIWRLPEDVLARIRLELIRIARWPWPWPPPPPDGPWPGPGPDPGPYRFDPAVLVPSPTNIAGLQAGPLGVVASATAPRVMERAAPGSALPQAPRVATSESRMTLSPAFPLEIQSALVSEALLPLRQAIINNPSIIQPFFCWWPWIWPWLICEPVAVLTTDGQGRFDTLFWYLCADTPDLYFWVEYCIGGTWTTVYAPPVRCATYWNYACGTEVILRVTDPRVPACGTAPTIPGAVLAVMTIGNNESVSQLQDAFPDPAKEGLTKDGRPFGGSLEPHVLFGNALPGAGVLYWRWSYRRLGTTAWTALDWAVVRHYLDDSNPLVPVIKDVELGPQTVGTSQNLFRLQDPLPPVGAWTPQVDAREDTASGFFRSWLLDGGNALLGAGKYELKLELFDPAGNLINLTDHGIGLFVPDPSVDAPFGPTNPPLIPAPARNLLLDTNGKVVAFRMVLTVDNNPCQSDIYDVTVDGVAAGLCGFIDYPAGSSALIQFLARHPNNFATFDFEVSKGSSGIVPITSASGPVGASPLNGFVRNPSSMFAKFVPVADLVGSCPGGKAAFAETISVWALATDGWNQLSYLDHYGPTRAFALEPGP